jgi:hypothetical protein
MPGGVVSPNIISNNEIFNLANADNYNGSYVISGWNFGSSGASYGPMSSTNCKGGSILSTFGAHMIMVVGIYLQQWNANNVTHTITNNKIYGLNSTVTGGTSISYILGIFDNTYGTNYTLNMDANKIYGLYGPDTYGSPGSYYLGLIGILSAPNQLGTHNITNNMIQLGFKLGGTSVKNSSITGIWDNSNWNNTSLKINFYHNSVFIGGTDNTCLNSYAFRRSLIYSSTVYDLMDLKNNIFVNNRSSASADHYGIYINDKLNLSSNYNLVYGTGTGFVSGSMLGTSYANLAAWQTATLLDANSLQTDPLFVNPAVISPDLHLQSSSPAIDAGTALTVVTDFDGDARVGARDIGADEYSAAYSSPGLGIIACGQETPLPVELLSFNSVCRENHAELHWITATETSNDFFTLERSTDVQDWEVIAKIKGAGNSNSIQNYSYSDETTTNDNVYYRLSQTDYDGKNVGLGLLFSHCDLTDRQVSVSCYPNPFTSEIMILFEGINAENASLIAYDMLGKTIMKVNLDRDALKNGFYLMKTSTLPVGIYSLEFFSDTYCKKMKLIKIH